MVEPMAPLVWELGNREAPSLAPSPHRQSPAVGQRKFGEGRKEEKTPDRFHLSKPRMVTLEACKPFSSQIHVFIFLTAGRCSKPPGLRVHPIWSSSCLCLARPRLLREALWLPGHESRSLREGVDVSPWPAACASAGWGGSARRWKTGPVFEEARAAERAQCVPSVSHGAGGQLGAGEERSPELPQEGPAWISSAWSGGRRARARREAEGDFQGWRDLREPCVTAGCLRGVRDEKGKGAVEAGSVCTHH